MNETEKRLPWDQRAARVLVRPLVNSPVTPNQVTVLTLVVACGGAALFAQGDTVSANWGAALFALARFLDHFDGELARQKAMTTDLGYYLDYIAGGLSYAALFAGIGWGLAAGRLGDWALVLGAVGAGAALFSMATNLRIDKLDADQRGRADIEAGGYPGFAGFELEDGIYLIAPLTWLGLLMPFFVAAGIGAGLYFLWTCWVLLRQRAP